MVELLSNKPLPTQEQIDWRVENPIDFHSLKQKKDMLKRDLNVNYSGGEKKKQEILQMSLLDPVMSILDETDSGLDIDALRVVSEGVNKLRNKDNSFLVITHYQRLLNYIKPDFVHIISDGKIVKSGGQALRF